MTRSSHCPSSKIVICKHSAKYNYLHVRTNIQEQNCALLCYYASSSGNFLTTFRDNLSVPPVGLSGNFLSTFRDKLLAPPSGFKWKFLVDVSRQPIGPIFGVEVEISCRRFGTTHRSHLWGWSGNFLSTFRNNQRSHLRGSSGNFLPTFRDNLSVATSGFKWKFLADVSGQPIGPTFGVQVEISCRHFGTTLRSHPRGSSGNFLLKFRDNPSVPILMVQELETWGWDRYVVSKRR